MSGIRLYLPAGGSGRCPPRVYYAIALGLTVAVGCRKAPQGQVAATAPAATQSSEPDEVDQGRAFMSSGDLAGALEHYSKAIVRDPSNVKALVLRASVYRQQAHYDLALRDLDQACTLAPGDAEPFKERGVVRGIIGDLQGAVDDLSQAISLAPPDTTTLINRGYAYQRLQQREKARADYERARAQSPHNPIPLEHLAGLSADEGKLGEALALLNDAVDMDPKLAETYLNRGVVHARRNELDDAIGDYSEAIRLDPKMADAYERRATAFDRKRRFAEADADRAAAKKLETGAPK